MKRNTSDLWPYLVIGSAVGGAVSYLFMTESGRRVRRSLAHPEDLPEKMEDARIYVERRTRMAVRQLQDILDRAKNGMEAGQRAFDEADARYRSQLRQIENKNEEIASTVHQAVDDLNKTAYTFEESVLEPIYELSALYRGIECGLRTAFGRKAQIAPFKSERITG